MKAAVKDSVGAIKRNYGKEIAFALFGCTVYVLLYGTHKELGMSLALGAYAAFLTLGKGLLFQSAAFLLCSAFFTDSFPAAVAAAAVITPFYGLAAVRTDEKRSKAICFGLLCLSQFFYVLTAEGGQAAERLLGIPVSLAAAFSFCDVAEGILSRGARYSPQGSRLLFAFVSAGLIAGGLEKAILFGINLSYAVLPFAILFTVNAFGKEKGVLLSFAAGAGCALFSGESVCLALWPSVGAVAAVFSGKRWASVLGGAITIPLFAVYFGKGGSAAACAVTGAASAAAFMLFPKKVLNSVRSGISEDGKYSVRHIVNRQRSNLSGRLYELSDVFFALQQSFRSMIRGVMPSERAAEAIRRDVSERVCAGCQERVRCWRTMSADTEKGFVSMTRAALDKGRATVIDVNNSLAARCGRISSVLAEINAQADAYKRYYTMTVNSDNGKSLIAEQMMGVSAVLSRLSTESKRTVTFDDRREKEIISALGERGVLCREAVLYDDGKELCAAIVADSGDVKKKGFSEKVSEVLKLPLMVDKVESAEEGEWKVVHFVPRPPYDVVFGFSRERKSGSEVSGDTHSFLRIDSGRFLLALCDGMGSGKDAEEASSRAVSLVENFYKAGFDNETVLSSVNRLLSTAGEDRFTAVDIALIDLRNGLADFIKIGAPAGLIRQAGGAEFIDGGSLPMGVLDEMRPVITKKALSEGDYLYLFSDGVEEAFGGKQALGAFSASLAEKDPQKQADEIMRKALSLSPEPKDDMTVIVASLVSRLP